MDLTAEQYFNLTVALLSIVLAIVSLLFSVLFYKWSEKSNKETTKLSHDIAKNTQQLEKLFDRLYSDTFGLMKSGYEAMQKSVFDQNMNYSNSSLSLEEEIEGVILVMVTRLTIVERNAIYHFFSEGYRHKGIEQYKIDNAIDTLKNKNKIHVRQDSRISLVSTSNDSDNDSDSSSN